jgi:hypothetical protein
MKNSITIHQPPKYGLIGECIDTLLRICCFIGYTLDESIFLFRQLFYSTFEIMPHGTDVINGVTWISARKNFFLTVKFEHPHPHPLYTGHQPA